MANSPSALPPGQGSPNQYISIGKAAALLGCSPESLRIWEREGKITAFRTCGSSYGQRRSCIESLRRQVLNIDPESESFVERKIAIYARVSSVGQKESAERQRERMLNYVSEKEGLKREVIALLKTD